LRPRFPRSAIRVFFTSRTEEGKIFFFSSRAASPHIILAPPAQQTLQEGQRCAAPAALKAKENEWRRGAFDRLK
jgi:hypothetical protein